MGSGDFARLAWIVPIFPLVAFLVIGLGGHRFSKWIGLFGIGAGGAAFVASALVFLDVLAGARVDVGFPWLPAASFIFTWGERLYASCPAGFAEVCASASPYPSVAAVDPRGMFPMGMQVDPLTAIMLVVVTSVSLLVQIYSTGYLPGDPQVVIHGGPGHRRYFAFMGLFTAAMLGLVLANNLLGIYIFWELVGLGSYLLIGHWYRKPEAAAAAKKAFIVTRIGDVGFLLGIVFLYWHARTLDVSALARFAESGGISQDALTVGMLLIFCGAIGKSAQFPLHVWLPDAMEGPTPVSALIHAATMVAAGVYLMARTFPLLEHAPGAMAVVALVGGFTALFAATMGLVARDIKRVLAHSTVSQLGYMLLGIGVGAMPAGIFHLFNHAFFKALLFLCAGSVIHLVETNDLFRMGGLRTLRPVTHIAMLIGALSLAGLFPLSGFWSKDEILVATASKQPVLFVMAMATVALTAFYMFRVIFLAFYGRYRGEHSLQGAGGAEGHDEPASMTIPLVVLLVPSIVTGLWGLPFVGNPFGSFLEGHPAQTDFRLDVALLSNLLAAGGAFLAWKLYARGPAHEEAFAKRWSPLYQCLTNGYYLNELYIDLGVKKALLGAAKLAEWFDTRIVDGAVNGGGALALGLSAALRRLQTGNVQTYGWVLFAGALFLVLALAIPRIAGRM